MFVMPIMHVKVDNFMLNYVLGELIKRCVVCKPKKTGRKKLLRELASKNQIVS